MLVREDRASYGEIWKNIIHGDYEYLIDVHYLLKNLRTLAPSNGIVQQKMDIRGNYKLLQDAVEAKDALRKFMSDLAASWSDKTRPKVEINSLSRICEKAARCYDGDFSRLLDIVRGYIVFSDGAAMLDGIRSILGRSDNDDIEILRVRNRMHPDKPDEDGGGYRNIIMNIRLRGYEHICELQITMRAVNQMRIRNANEQRYRMFRNQRAV